MGQHFQEVMCEKEFRPGVSSFAVATSTMSHMEWILQEGIPGYWQYRQGNEDIAPRLLQVCARHDERQLP